MFKTTIITSLGILLMLTNFSYASSGKLVLTQNTTLSEDHSDGQIVLMAPGIKLDCAGFKLIATSSTFPGDGSPVSFVMTVRDNTSIENCKMEGGTTIHSAVGIALRSNGNTVKNNTMNNVSIGIDANLSNGNTINGNSVTNANLGYLIYRSNNNNVYDNTATDVVRSGLVVGPFVNGMGFAILDSSFNSMHDNKSTRAYEGFVVDSSGLTATTNNVLDNNTAIGSTSVSLDNGGFRLGGTADYKSSNNILQACSAIEGASVGFVVVKASKNELFENNANKNGDHGYLIDRSDNIRMTKNTASLNGLSGFSLKNSSGFMMKENTASSSLLGFHFLNSSNSNGLGVKENVVSSNGTGLKIENSQNILFLKNIIAGSETIDINQDAASTGNTYKDNKFGSSVGVP